MARKRPVPPTPPEPSANLAGLVQACKDEPDDDSLRLILADYLTDHGEPERAEMIRLSVATAGVEPASVAALHVRLARLCRDHDGGWLGGLGGQGVAAGFDRGFVAVEGTVSGLGTRRNADALAAVGHWGERLRLGGLRATVAPFIASPAVAAFSALALDVEIDSAVAAVLAGAAAAPRLRELVVRLKAGRVNPTGLLFAPAGPLGRLRRLTLDGPLSVGQVRALAGAAFAPGLRALSLASPLGGDQAAVLARAEAFAGLEALHVGVEPPAVWALVESAHLRPRRLSLSGRWITEEAGLTLARSPLLAGMRSLRLSAFTVTGRVAAALAAAPALALVEELHLGGCAIDDDGAAALAASGHLATLRRLDLSHNRIGPAGARAIAASPHLARLEHFDLGGNPLGPDGAAALLESGHLAALRDLAIASVGADGRAVEALIAGPVAPRLRWLDLRSNPLGPDAPARLARAESLAGLEALDLRYTGNPDDGLVALAGSAALRRLVWLAVSVEPGAAAALAALAGRHGLPALAFLGVDPRFLPSPPASVARALAESPRRGDLFVPFYPSVYSLLSPPWRGLLSPAPRGSAW